MDRMIFLPKELPDISINNAKNKVKLTFVQTLFLGILAGMFIALGGFSSTIASYTITNFSLKKLVAGIVFPVGLMLVIICGAELFTGNSLMITAWFSGDVKLSKILKNWIIVYVANFIGSFFIAFLVYNSGILNTQIAECILKTAIFKCSLPFGNAVVSGILCNILVCCAVLMTSAAKDVTGKMIAIVFPIMAFVIAGFEHSVANMYFLSIAILCKGNKGFITGFSQAQLSSLTFTEIWKNLIPVTLGNIIGGAFIVSLFYFIVFGRSRISCKKFNDNVINL